MQTSRRRFLAASAALPFAARALASVVPRSSTVFLGTDKGQGIYRATFDYLTGALTPIELAVATARPDFLALHPILPVLYTVNSTSGPSAALSSFYIERGDSLTRTSHISSHGDGPCAISVDRTGSLAFVANYTGGSFAAFRLDREGSLISTVATLDCRNNPVCGALGPIHDRQNAAHIHCVTVSPANDFVLVCNLGEDSIELFPLAPKSSTPVGTPVRVAARAGSGPRHLAFHPNRRWLYCIHELDCTVDLYDWSLQPQENSPQLQENSPQPHEDSAQPGHAAMHLRSGSVVSTLSPGVALTGNTACELIVSDDGRFLYTCTRGTGSDSLTIYRIDPATGLLTEHQRLSCGGAIPRYITFDPTGRWLLCTNQGSPDGKVAGSVTVFRNDPATGHLRETPQTFPAPTPMFALFTDRPRFSS